MIPPTEEGRPSQGEGAGESVKNRKFSKWVVLLPQYNNAKERNLLWLFSSPKLLVVTYKLFEYIVFFTKDYSLETHLARLENS